MRYEIIVLAIFSFILIGCTQSINRDNIERSNGLYFDIKRKELLHGKYKSVVPIGGTYSGNHESTFTYDKGIPVGEWTYVFNGDPIHSGKYLIQNNLKSKINSLTGANRTDVNL